MPIDVSDLRSLVGAGVSDDAVLTHCLEFGRQIVATYTVAVEDGVIPDVVLDEAVLTAAADQFQRRKAPNGVLNQVFDGEQIPVRISRDPFASIKPLLKPWVNPGGLCTVQIGGDS